MLAAVERGLRETHGEATPRLSGRRSQTHGEMAFGVQMQLCGRAFGARWVDGSGRWSGRGEGGRGKGTATSEVQDAVVRVRGGGAGLGGAGSDLVEAWTRRGAGCKRERARLGGGEKGTMQTKRMWA